MRVCDVNQRETLRQTPNGAPPSPRASHCLQAPKTYRPNHPRTRTPSRRHDARASKQPAREWPLFFAGAVARQNAGRLPSRVMFGTMPSGLGPTPGGQSKTWHKFLVDDLRVFRATEGSPEHPPLVFGVEIALWQAATKKAGKWCRGVLGAAGRFMVARMKQR